tara:strand:- start:5522 stop:7081 length:1560 start_codon:yes stop_codon:yes gene_type:complete
MIEKYLNNRFFTLILTPFILGCLSVFSFQPFNLTVINFFILPSFFYLVFYIKKKSKSTYRKKPFRKNLFMCSTFFGFGFYLAGIHWITYSLTFDENFKFLIPFALILIPLFLSLFISLTILAIGNFINLNFSSIILFSSSLAFSDYLRSKILTGFPWNLWAYSFSSVTEIIQIVNKIGLFAFNLLSITIFVAPIIIFFKIELSKKILLSFALIFTLLSLYLYGSHSINHNQDYLSKVKDKFYIKAISPKFDLKYGLSSDEIKTRLQELIKYSSPEKNIKTLFVWPEGVFSGYDYNDISQFKNIFSENFNKNHFILLGVNRYDSEKKSYYNSLVIVDNQFKIIQEYKKRKLVPFGEFLPMSGFLNKFGFKKITEGHGSFLKGDKSENLKLENLNILPLICYEIIFTELTQQSSKNSNLIINISEDGWFGTSIGPQQHFIKGIFRAIEHNSYLVRSANKGITAIINNKGEIEKKLNPSEIGYISQKIPLIKTNKKNKNDLIFFILLFTYALFFKFNKNRNA